MSKLNWKILRFTHYYNAAALDHTLTWGEAPRPHFLGILNDFYAESLQQSTCSTLHISVSDKKVHFEKSSNMWNIFVKLLWSEPISPALAHPKTPASQKKFSTFMYERDPYAHIIGLIILLRRAPSSACCFEFEFNGFLWGDRRLLKASLILNSFATSKSWLLLAAADWCFALAK